MGDARKGQVSDCWLMLLQPTTTAVGREPKAEGELGVASEELPEASRWDGVVSDYPDAFAEPGMPAERGTKHKIELLPGSKP